ncbi:hypothetical protein MPTK1_7g03900 [Marchantia polymorpha subsp. ruderalis]|uniref:RRM domain-containing protein n=2 Tax=Marchantia polymorpha TaxID=3197 RepID=A0AAF6BVX2_MARPO|nr:hypothetical protein MARPO_0074s0009 [Marchantia polymorpha]BBN16156.1 hypothetical protein Mp_7g03900 [Marchantia polymorpha subsp. ruderalis]|eukprot:PTQ35011.1 hypothetical protein MARPO_0074s0009 [Marchantia polymorpha]
MSSYRGNRGGGYGGGRDGGPPGDRNSRYDGGGGGGGNRNGDRGYGNSNEHGGGGGGGGYRSGGGHGGGGRSAEREQGGYGGGGGGGGNNDDGRSGYGGEVGGEEPPPVKVKQCDDECGDTCDNTRIYISGLPLDVTVDELRELFGGIGQVARIKQKRGYKDQWPWNVKIYTDEAGKNKGDAVLTYEDPSAAHSAGSFFNDHSLRGNKIKVTMAEKSAPRAPTMFGRGGGGGGGGFRGGSGRNNNTGGPDRRDGGGYRSRPY